MVSFTHSVEALDVISEFQEVDKIIYVEGSDDEIFWGKLFSFYFDNLSFKVERLGGKPELLKAMDALQENDNLSYYVALDSDYSFYTNEIPNLKRVFRTFGHSIENTLIQENTVIELLDSFGVKKNIIQLEFSVLDNSVTSLINNYLSKDISCIENSQKSIIGKNISKFKATGKIYNLEQTDFQKYLFDYEVTEEFHKSVTNCFKQSGLKALDIINGHFIFSVLLKFIEYNTKKFRKSIKLTNDSLFCMLISIFKLTYNEEHPHFHYYASELQKIS